MTIIEEIKASFKGGTNLTRLIYVNTGVFLVLHLVLVILFLLDKTGLNYTVLQLFAVPADLSSIAAKPWTVVSYMFLHKEFFHLLFNLLWLYWFGKIFIQYIGDKSLLSVYLLGGLCGALFFITAYNIFPALSENLSGSMAMGASAAVMAIVIAIATYAPDHIIYIVFIGPVKIIWVALIGFILSSVVDFSVNTGGKIAHIGGAVFGYYFALRYRNGVNVALWFEKLITVFLSWFKPRKRKMKVSYKRNVSDIEYNTRLVEKQKDIDRILDKISSKGYNSLSDEEKAILFKSGGPSATREK